MNSTPTRCLILACGNTLRGDDGVGPWLAQWARERFLDDERVRVLIHQQWTPELACDIAAADSVLFIDCSTSSPPGSVNLEEVQPAGTALHGLATHHVGAPELLEAARELYDSLPRSAMMLTVGAGSIEMSEQLSQPVLDAVPIACTTLEKTIAKLLCEK